MGHLSARDAHHSLQAKLDRFSVGAPGRETIQKILSLLYTKEEAEIAALVPFRFSSVRSLAARTGIPEGVLQGKLEAMAGKGLLLDMPYKGRVRYMLAPTMVGLFEFSMMRARDDIDQKKLAELLHQYIMVEPEFMGQFDGSFVTTPFRTLVHETTLPESYTEILDWERATHVVSEARSWAVGLCHCRHVQHHVGPDCEKFRLDSCMTLNYGADYVSRHGLGRSISREEALDLLVETREAGLVHSCDNVRDKPTYLCNCCGCCCELLRGYRNFEGLTNTFSSNFEARVDEAGCTGCGKCVAACPVDAIAMVPAGPGEGRAAKRKTMAVVHEDVCIGCGVCVPSCKFSSLAMSPRPQRRIAPENGFARAIAAALEQGCLHELLADPDDGWTARGANVFLGAVLRLPPTKQLLLNEKVKSRFINFLIEQANRAGVKGSSL